MRTVEWLQDSNQLQMIDQRLLPGDLKLVVFDSHTQVADAIKNMVVRGAPAIGASAAFGLALAAFESKSDDGDGLRRDLRNASDVLRNARPTAVNLAWALDRIIGAIPENMEEPKEIKQIVLQAAQEIADEDVKVNQRMAQYGADLIPDGGTVIHHCNTGALATVDWGTALGVIRMAHEQGKNIHVLLDETRPRMQGARLSAWELENYGVPYDVISDNAAGHFLSSGKVDAVFVGADRVAANGDVANKIGTYMLALAAHDNQVPFYAVVPTSTIDLSLSSGAEIPIEERSSDEVLGIQRNGSPLFPAGASAQNPAFDITPNRLVTAIVTEYGLVYPPFEENLAQAVKRNVA